MFTHRASKSASAYKQVSVETSVGQASPHNLVEMLFDGLLVAVGAARAAMQRGDIKTKCKQIVHCGAHPRRRPQVRPEPGAGWRTRLESGSILYGYCVVRLTQANARNDDAALAEVAAPDRAAGQELETDRRVDLSTTAGCLRAGDTHDAADAD
jgi:flagellar protein FliS